MTRLFTKLVILLQIVSFLLIVGCKADIQDKDFVYTVAISGYLFGLSDEDIPAKDIDARIYSDEIILCKYSECPSPDGQVFYTLHSAAIYEAIAREVEVNDGKKIYKKCIKIRKV
ncbi:hypothetical protein [Cohnella yongneupensis]|uniref:Lipoprotein n=1 Tax=Cohnella yongneupensis TaxID=425006 RepID=A0ABW0QTZ3_9BACL